MKLTFVIELDGDRLVAHCLELGTASCGKDIPEAIEMIADATAVYIRVCLGLDGRPEKFEEWWQGREDRAGLEDAEEALKDYVRGEAISVLETHERMKTEGEL